MSLIFLFFIIILLSNPSPSLSQQARSFSLSDFPWRPTQNKVLVSRNKFFAAGFKPTPSAPNRYIFSIWYYNISGNNTIVWSANANSPVTDDSSLGISDNGVFRLIESSSGRNLLPGSSSATRNPNSTSLVLDDSGNLVYGSWESFNYPTDTILSSQIVNRKKERTLQTKNGKFNNENAFIKLEANGVVTQDNRATLVSSDFDEQNKSRRLTLDDDGNLRVQSFDIKTHEFTVVWLAVQEMCTVHGTCGDNAICMNDASNTDPTFCVCPPGFKNNTNVNESNSCVIKTPWNNNHGNTKFLQLDYVNFYGSDLKVHNFSVCQLKCLANPNCLGFDFKYDGKCYCVLQINQLRYGYCTTLRNIVIICTLFAAGLIFGVLFFWGFLKKYIKYRDMARSFSLEFLPAGGPKWFTYAELQAAADNFSNSVRKGGIGDVYKGKLGDHRVVAVKCSKNVTGGDAEFWAEVTIIARMYHLNFVRLWGFCAEKGQRILVYEHVRNGSLDKYLFPVSQILSLDKQEVINLRSTDLLKPILDWNIRYIIALDVARVIVYLHEECLEWAKLRKKEDMVSMSMARGTRGYMALEWLKPDPITPKADVYSFGMVLLDLVSGVGSNNIQGSLVHSEDLYLPRWAFGKVFKDMKVDDILDRQIKHCFDNRLHFDFVDRMVNTAIWCLQDLPEVRPSIGKVAKMLEGTVEIIEPK
ncbi:hypothetical protein V6Z11_D05G331000 [Gossypium hirsutum]